MTHPLVVHARRLLQPVVLLLALLAFGAAASAATITSLSATKGYVSGGQDVAILGSGFTDATAVSFGSVAVTSFQVEDESRIVVTVPAASGPGAVSVSVEAPSGNVTLANAFTYTAAPVLTTTQRIGGVEGNTLVTAPRMVLLVLDVPAVEAFSVAYATADGTATAADNDYVAASGTVTFEPGDTLKFFPVTVFGDVKYEEDERFYVDLSASGAVVLETEQVTVDVLNDDYVTLSIPAVQSVTEGSEGPWVTSIPVTLSEPSRETVTVNFHTEDAGATVADNDYVPTSGTLTFLPGETSKTIDLTIIGDKNMEAPLGLGAEAVDIVLTSPVSATLERSFARITLADDDEYPSMTISDGRVIEGDDGVSYMSFKVELSGRLFLLPATANFSTSSNSPQLGAATPGEDYEETLTVAVFDAGQTEFEITVPIYGDTGYEPDETFSVSLSSTTLGGGGFATGTIENDDAPPAVSVGDVTAAEGDSATKVFSFPVTLSAASEYETRVDFVTADGTAVSPGDYTATSGTVTIPAGSTSAVIDVTVVGDTVIEPHDTFTVNLSNPVNATIARAQATGTITDDDALPTVSVGDVSGLKGGSGATTIFSFPVTLSAASEYETRVDFATADGTAISPREYTAASGTVTIPAGSTSAVIDVTVIGRDSFETPRTFTVNLSNPVNATIARGQGTGFIASTDALPEISISGAAGDEPANGSSANFVFQVSLNMIPGFTHSVAYRTEDVTASAAAGDYEATSGTLTFAPGERIKTITVRVKGDNVYERGESFALVLSDPVNATIQPPGRAVGFIRENGEPPFATFRGVAQDEGDSGTSVMSLPISLSWPTDEDLTFGYRITGISASVADNDYVDPAIRSVTIPAGSTEASVDVVINGDTKVEPNETFRVNIASEGGEVRFQPEGDIAFGMIVNDDEGPPLPKLSIVAETARAEEGAPRGGGRLIYTIQLSEPSSQTVFFDLETVGGTAQAPGDFTAHNRTMGISAGRTSNLVIVELVGDLEYEPDETLTVRISNPIGATIDVAEASGTILNDDEPPELTVRDVTASEGGGGTTIFSFPVTLSEVSGYETSVDFATADGTAQAPGDYTAASGTVTIPAGSTSAVIDVTVIGDGLAEPNETFTVNISNPVNATIYRGQGTGTIVDGAGPVSITTTALPDPRIGDAYSQAIQTTGGTPPLSFSLVSGRLPDGISLGADGTLSGTPTEIGNFTFEIKVTDSATPSPTEHTRAFTLRVPAPLHRLDPAPPGTAALRGQVGTPYSVTFNPSRGTAPYSFSIASGALPAGLSLSASGEISGTPTAAGSFSVRVQLMDSTAGNPWGIGIRTQFDYGFTIDPPNLAPDPALLSGGSEGSAYSATLSASGGTAPYSYAVTAGTLPAGLTLSAGGVLSGTPTTSGIFNFTVTATDSSTGTGAPFAGARVYALEVTPPPPPIAGPVSASVAYNSAGSAISPALSGGPATSVAVTTPPGNGTVTVSGLGFTYTPVANYVGPDSFSYTATGPGGTSAPATVTITVGLPPAPVASNFTASAVPYDAPATFSVTGHATNSPTGYAVGSATTTAGGSVSIDSSGTVSFTPAAGFRGADSFTFTASNLGGTSAPATVTVPVGDPVFAVTPATAPDGAVAAAYSQDFTVSGGRAPYTITLTGTLPAGLSATQSGDTLTVAGTPTAAGSFSFGLSITDSSTGLGGFTASHAFTLDVAAPTLALTPTTLAAATVGAAYSETLTTSGGTAPYSYAVTSGSLPAGLSLTTAGTLTGTPTAGGSFTATVTATDSSTGTDAPFSVSQPYTLVVNAPAIALTPATLPAATQFAGYSQTITASGGTPGYSYAVTAGALPAGLSLSSEGALSGAPSVFGTFDFTITATDTSTGTGPYIGAQSYTLVVDQAPPTIASLAPNEGPSAGGTVVTITGSNFVDVTGVTFGGVAATGVVVVNPTTITATTPAHAAGAVAVEVTTPGGTATSAGAFTYIAPGAIRFVVNSGDDDGAFIFSSPTAGLNFTVTTSGGTGQSGNIALAPGSYSLAFTVPDGFGLDAASCSPSTSTVNTSARTASIAIASGVTTVCTIEALGSRRATTEMLGAALNTSSRLIIANAPSVSRRLDRLNGGGGAPGSASAFGKTFAANLPFSASLGADQASFSMSLSRLRAMADTDHRFTRPDGVPSGVPSGVPASLAASAEPVSGLAATGAAVAATQLEANRIQRFDIWVEGAFAWFDSTAASEGDFAILHAGADYLVSDHVLIGVGIQGDWLNMDTASGSLDSSGWLAGPYLTARLTEGLYLDLRAAWGGASFDVSPFGTYTDTVDSDRALYSAALIGQFVSGDLTIRPEARLTWYRETTEAYVDSLSVLIPEIEIETGEVTFGPTFEWSLKQPSGALLTPSIGFDLVWTFEQKNAATQFTGAPGLDDTGLRGRIEAGLGWQSETGVALGGSLFYDGIGQSDYEAWGAKASFKMGF